MELLAVVGARVDDLGQAPLGIVGLDLRQRAQRIQLSHRVHPAAHRRPHLPPPRVQREEHVKVPQRERLDREVEDRGAGAQLGEAEDAGQAAQAGRGITSRSGQPRSDVAETRRGVRCAKRMREQVRIAREGLIHDERAIEVTVDVQRGDEREDHAGDDRDQPVRAAAVGGGVQRDQAPDRHGDHHDRHPQPDRRLGRERPRALGPAEKGFELGAADSGDETPVRRQVFAPFDRCRQFDHRQLAFGDLDRRRRAEHPALERQGPGRGGRGTEPLQQRRPAEQIEVVRVWVTLDAGGRVGRGRQSIPGPANPRQRVEIHGAQGIVPGDPLLHARMPDDQHREDQQQREPTGQRGGREGAGARDGEQRDARNDGRQAQTRDAGGDDRFRIPASRVRGHLPLVVGDHAGFRASMLRRQ